MTDKRPLISEPPAWAKAMGEEFDGRVNALFEELWQRAQVEATTNPNSAEAENDALSLLGHVVSRCALRYIEKLEQKKGCGKHLALKVALMDLQMRATISLMGGIRA